LLKIHLELHIFDTMLFIHNRPHSTKLCEKLVILHRERESEEWCLLWKGEYRDEENYL